MASVLVACGRGGSLVCECDYGRFSDQGTVYPTTLFVLRCIALFCMGEKR